MKAEYIKIIGKSEFEKLNNVKLVCEASNIASVKTIESLGGILEKTEIDENDNKLTNYYWIDVDKASNEKMVDVSFEIKERAVVFPVPFGNTTAPLNCWSAFLTSKFKFIATSTVASNLQLVISLTNVSCFLLIFFISFFILSF